MACGPIDYRRQQRERWIEMAYQITLSHRWAERIVDAIMESEHSVVADHPDTKLSQEVERLRAENWEQAAELEDERRSAEWWCRTSGEQAQIIREQAAEIERLKAAFREARDLREHLEMELVKARKANVPRTKGSLHDG